MAKRIRSIFQTEATRQKIKTSQLINRLEKHILGNLELTNTQVKGIEILLRKTLPDLASTQLSNDPNNPITTPSINIKMSS